MITALVATAVLGAGAQGDFSKLRAGYSGEIENVPGYKPKSGTKVLDFVEQIHIFFIRPKRYHIEMPGAVIGGHVDWRGDILTLTPDYAMDTRTGGGLASSQLEGIDKARSKKVVDWATGQIQLKISKDFKRIDAVKKGGISKYDFYFGRRY